MKESLPNPTDAITVTNEDAAESAPAAFPPGIPDHFMKLLIAERQGRILERQGENSCRRSGTRRTTGYHERPAHPGRLQQDSDTTPDDFKPIAKRNSRKYKN